MSVAWLRAVAATRVGSPGEWAVLVALAVHQGGRDGVAWPSLSRIAGHTGLSQRHVRTCVRKLEARGMVERVERPARLPATGYVRSVFYRVTI